MTLEELAELIIGRLTDDAYFAEAGKVVPVTDAADKDLLAKYASKVGSMKVHVLLQVTGVPKLESEAPVPHAQCGMVLQIRENWAVNRGAGGTGKTAQAVAQKILQLLWLWPVPGSGGVVKVTGMDGLTDEKVSAWDVTVAVPWAGTAAE